MPCEHGLVVAAHALGPIMRCMISLPLFGNLAKGRCHLILLHAGRRITSVRYRHAKFRR